MPRSQKGLQSRVLLQRLRDSMAEPGNGQARLDRIVKLIASSMNAEVCSIYLKKDVKTLELFATEGLKAGAVHFTQLKIGQGLVGKIAHTAISVNTSNAPKTKGFRFMPETGEEVFPSFLGVPIQRLGEVLGVLIVQNSFARAYNEDEVYGLEIVAMVIAEMTELGEFTEAHGAEITAQHNHAATFEGIIGNEGIAIGEVFLHDPMIKIENPISDNPKAEKAKLSVAFKKLQAEAKKMSDKKLHNKTGEYLEVFEAYQMFARDKGWRKRMEASIEGGLAAAVAVEKEQSEMRSRMSRLADPYIRDRLHDLDDISNRLIRILTKTDVKIDKEKLTNAILIARNIGPAELLDYGPNISGVILEEGSVGSHATIVARALAIPLVIKADGIRRESRDGDLLILDADKGHLYLRPEETIRITYADKLASQEIEREQYLDLKNKPAQTSDGVKITLMMNAGLMVDLPFLEKSGAEGIGLYRTELQFLTQEKMPKRSEQAEFYSHILDMAAGKPVNFRSLDIGSDKILPYLKGVKEPNPSLGWRAIRVTLDRTGIMRMQVQALIRGAQGRPIRILFPFVTELDEFKLARNIVLSEIEKEKKLQHVVPKETKIGAMLETPSLAFSNDEFFQLTDFISIGGNDLKQFFFAADRENELVRARYDTLNLSYLDFLEGIVARAKSFNTPINFCGEDAGKPAEAVALMAIGLTNLSMRAASVGRIKSLIRFIALEDAKIILSNARKIGKSSIRKDITDWLEDINAPCF